MNKETTTSSQNDGKLLAGSSLPLTMTEILAEAERRYPEQISVEGKDSDKKQRKNQRLFIEGARWMQAVWLAVEQ